MRRHRDGRRRRRDVHFRSVPERHIRTVSKPDGVRWRARRDRRCARGLAESTE